MLKVLFKQIFKKEKRLLSPVKTKCRPENAISNWHWRKYMSDHMPLEDWELEELDMSPEEASAEIEEWDR